MCVTKVVERTTGIDAHYRMGEQMLRLRDDWPIAQCTSQPSHLCWVCGTWKRGFQKTWKTRRMEQIHQSHRRHSRAEAQKQKRGLQQQRKGSTNWEMVLVHVLISAKDKTEAMDRTLIRAWAPPANHMLSRHRAGRKKRPHKGRRRAPKGQAEHPTTQDALVRRLRGPSSW